MSSAPKYRSIVYYADYSIYARNFTAVDLEPFLTGVTDIAYAFFNIQDSGGGNYVIIAGDSYS